MLELNKIYNEDCMETMARMPDNFVDLTVTSPPYDNLRSYKNDIDKTWGEHVWKPIIEELYRVTKEGGVVVWVVGDATIKGSETGTAFRQALYFQECGFNIHDTMIWRKTNPMPQVKQPRYSSEFEYMFIFSVGKPKTFNPIMVPTKCGGNKYNSTAKKITSGRKREPLNYIVNHEKVKGAVWDIAVAQNKTAQTAVFPEQLANDHIISWSNQNDIVYDPFVGSGTTAKMAVVNNRQYVGSEISQEYCEIAKKRVADAIKDKAQQLF